MAPGTSGPGAGVLLDDLCHVVVLGGGHGHPSSAQLGHWLDTLGAERRAALTVSILAGIGPCDNDFDRYTLWGSALVDAYRDDAFNHRDDWRGFGASYRDCPTFGASDDTGPPGADRHPLTRAMDIGRGGARLARVLRGRFVHRVSTSWAFALSEVGR